MPGFEVLSQGLRIGAEMAMDLKDFQKLPFDERMKLIAAHRETLDMVRTAANLEATDKNPNSEQMNTEES